LLLASSSCPDVRAPASPFFPYTTLFRSSGQVGYPFFGELILDVLNRTENAMTQEHAFKAVELALTAQAQASASSTALKACSWVIDRKSTRLNSSHVSISYAVFCLKKKKH